MNQTEITTTTESVAQTESAGAELGRTLRRGDLVSLHGSLGAGKTVFVRGLVSGLGGDAALVRSPTFVLHHVYRCPQLTLHHADLYRLGPGGSIEFLDVDGLVSEGAVVIEWGEYAELGEYNPIDVSIETLDETRRKVLLAANDQTRWTTLWTQPL